jgi:uncharacterized protein
MPPSAVTPSAAQRQSACNRPNGLPIMHQRWADLLFLHWPIDPALIQARLPKGLHVDTFAGTAWIGIIPFLMQRVRPSGLPPLPWLSWFHELNVRTYVHDDSGNPGVWFFSLDCNQPLAVEIARRCFHLPYEHAVMRSQRNANTIQYHSRRKTPVALDITFEYETPRTTQPALTDSLEWFLVERYLLFSSNPTGEIFVGRVHHAPYQIAAGGCGKFSTEPLRLNGFPTPQEEPASILTATTVDVKVFPLRKIRGL